MASALDYLHQQAASQDNDNDTAEDLGFPLSGKVGLVILQLQIGQIPDFFRVMEKFRWSSQITMFSFKVSKRLCQNQHAGHPSS